MEAISEIIVLGRDLRLLNLLNACRKISSVTISRWIALVTAQVSKHTYTFTSLPESLAYKAPVKSILVTSNGNISCILALIGGGGSGAW